MVLGDEGDGNEKQSGAHGEKGITGAWEAELDFAGGAAE